MRRMPCYYRAHRPHEGDLKGLVREGLITVQTSFPEGGFSAAGTSGFDGQSGEFGLRWGGCSR
jgi:hypothetical protein